MNDESFISGNVSRNNHEVRQCVHCQKYLGNIQIAWVNQSLYRLPEILQIAWFYTLTVAYINRELQQYFI